MRKTLTCSSFIIAGILVILVFLTATSYSQLGVAIVLYPLLVYFAYKLFISNPSKITVTKIFPAIKSEKNSSLKQKKVRKKVVEVVDIEKRAFLKLIGATGVSFLIFSILGRKAESLLFGRSLGGDTSSTETLPTNGYQISQIDDSTTSFYGFTNKDGGWFIMKEDPEKGSFRYTKGESNFAANWDQREELNYDYYHKVFP